MGVELFPNADRSVRPEPLVANRRNIGVDLDGTLVYLNPSFDFDSIFALRPGAIRLLSGLKDRGLQPVLMSAKILDTQVLLDRIPEFSGFFARYLWDDTIIKTQKQLLESSWMGQIARADGDLYMILRSILLGNGGGKYPPLFDIGAGIIDDVMAHHNSGKNGYAELLNEYTFPVYDPRALRSDTYPDAWVDRVLGSIDEELRRYG